MSLSNYVAYMVPAEYHDEAELLFQAWLGGDIGNLSVRIVEIEPSDPPLEYWQGGQPLSDQKRDELLARAETALPILGGGSWPLMDGETEVMSEATALATGTAILVSVVSYDPEEYILSNVAQTAIQSLLTPLGLKVWEFEPD